jgi:uncharacterized protein (DUF58 family)
MALDPDFIKALDRLKIILKKRVYADRQGEHHTPQGGDSLIFRDYKAYAPGDDFRRIDWKIYARTDKFYIRRFEAERNVTVHILVDASASMQFGSKVHGKMRTKFEYAAMMGMGFAYLAVRNNEKFNLNTFTEHVTAFKPRKGASNLAYLLDYLDNLKVEGKSNFMQSMDEYRKRITSKSLIVLASDFLYDLNEVEEILGRYRKCQVFVIQVLDSQEKDLQLQGDVILEDSETEEKMRTFVSNRLRNTYQDRLGEHIARLKNMCERNGANFMSLTSNTPAFEAFYHMFR